MSTTRNLALPLLAAGQAQKHVTHNEALTLLDALVQVACLDKDLSSPPPAPAEGDRYLVTAPRPGGAWAALSGQVALYQDGAWTGLAPRAGWLAYLLDEAELYLFNGQAWTGLRSSLKVLENLTRLGINTAADASNRLAVKAEGALFSWDEATPGTGSLQLTLNKQAAGKDAGLSFQTGFSARALLGTFGSDDLSVKVSPDGAAFVAVLTASAATGRLTLGRVVGPLEVSTHPGTLPALPAAAVARISGGDGAAAQVLFDGFGAAGTVAFRTAKGTAAAPAAVTAGLALGGVAALGYGATGYSASARAQVQFQAAETWTDAAQGTRIAFGTTRPGSLTVAETVACEANGALRLLPLAADPAGGALGMIYVNSTETALKWHNGTAWARLNNFAKFAAFTNFNNYIAVNTWTKVQFNNADSNDQGVFVSAQNRFVAAEAGLHGFGVALTYKRNGTNNPTAFEVQFYRNGAAAGRGRAAAPGTIVDGVTALNLRTVLKLAAGDTVEVFVRFTGADGYVAAADSCFSGEQLA